MSWGRTKSLHGQLAEKSKGAATEELIWITRSCHFSLWGFDLSQFKSYCFFSARASISARALAKAALRSCRRRISPPIQVLIRASMDSGSRPTNAQANRLAMIALRYQRLNAAMLKWTKIARSLVGNGQENLLTATAACLLLEKLHTMKYFQRHMLALAGLCTLGAVCPNTVNANEINLVQNGSFESFWAAWGWTVNVGVFQGYPGAPDGSNWAAVYGTIYQDLPTIPGESYHISFTMSGNQNFTGEISLQANWANSLLGTTLRPPGFYTITDLGWINSSYDVVATSRVTRISFANPALDLQLIPYLDDIKVVAGENPPITPDPVPDG